MKNTLYLVAFLCFGFAAGWLAHGRLRPPHRHHDPDGLPPPMDHMMDEVGASEQQRADIRAVVERHKAEGQKIHENLDQARKAFVAALPTDQDRAALQPKFQALLDAKRAAELEHFATMMDVRATLTPDQRKILENRHRADSGEAREP